MNPVPGIVTLSDPDSRSQARILTDFGFNCFDFRAAVDDRLVDVLWSAEKFEKTHDRPSGSGNPILFPFPGRLAGTNFRWGDQSFTLPAGDGIGNPIHGFVLDRPWRVLDQQARSVRAVFQASIDAPELLERWPADFCIQGTYTLEQNSALKQSSLRATFVISNPGQIPLPCGLGLHPYFRLPLGDGNADVCQVTLPVRKQWELVEMLPTGKVIDVPDAKHLQAGIPFAQMNFDNVFTDLVVDDGWSRSYLRDQQNGCELELAFNDGFRECVVYTPPHRQAICVEPYTCVPGAMQMQMDAQKTGLQVLEPQQSLQLTMVITVRPRP